MDFPGQIDPVLQKEKLLISGRHSAAAIAAIMQISGFTPAERDELRVCRDRLEQHVKVRAEAEATDGEEIGSLAERMADVLAECAGIIHRVQDRPPGR
jgi:hypothetical protein